MTEKPALGNAAAHGCSFRRGERGWISVGMDWQFSANCLVRKVVEPDVCSRKNEQSASGLLPVDRPGSFAAPMRMLKMILRDRRFHRLAAVGLVLGVGALLLAWKMGLDGAMLKAGWKTTENFLIERPWLLFAGLVVLPGLPVPMSALLFLVGTVWRDRPVVACGICLVAIILNMSWTYWAAAKPGRGLVEKFLAAGSIRIPDLPKGDHLRMTLLLRLTPGVPFFIQNYLLGFLRVPFGMYLPVSVGCNGLISVGIVLSGAGIADGNLKPLITGVALIVVGVIVVQMIRQKLRGSALSTKGHEEEK
jgi:uncharacterized membrane protein YdjX (TVP38/TMEM64 family)